MNRFQTRELSSSLLLLVATLVTGLCFVNTQSFWMDEGNAIIKAIMPTPKAMLDFAKHLRGSEIQMPFFMITLWGWEKIVGHSEYLLRLVNLPFLVITVFALRRMPFWPLVCLTSPFLLYYVGELRPYMFQIAGAAVGFASLWRIAQPQEAGKCEGLHGLLGSCVFLAATSLTAGVWSLGLMIGMLVLRPDWLKAKGFWLKAAAWLPLALVVGGYHAFMLAAGYRGAVSRGGGLLSMGFGFYELMGMMGMGPQRDTIRTSSVIGLLGGHPWLLLYAVLFTVAWVGGVRTWLSDKTVRVWLALALAAIIPLFVLAGVSVFANFSVLGRHMSPLLIWMLLPVGWFLHKSLQNKTWLAVSVPLLAGAVVSAVILRSSDRHERDDYRQATALVLEDLKKGHTVQWNADMNAPRFYVYREGGVAMMNAIQILESEKPETLFSVDVIYINRPDLRYPAQDHAKIFAREGFQLEKELKGFEIWRSRYSR
jgi:hypothetical protein